MGVSPKRLPPLPTIADIIRLYGLRARSQLSQNFLLDLNVTDKVVGVAGDVRGCCVCEVGPGPGALTRSILNRGASHLVVVEKDRRFLPSLELVGEASGGRVDIIHGDVLEVGMETVCQEYVQKRDWEDDPPEFHVIGNLPFNVSIPLLLQWLVMIPGRCGPFSFGRTQLTLTFQKEVAERIIAPAGHSQRSRLSIMTQNLCHVQWGFTIPGSVFTPSPKVDAVVLKLTPRLQPQVKVDHPTLESVVKALFQFRRKFIKRGASKLFPTQPHLTPLLFSLSGVPHTLRAQELTMEQVDLLSSTYLHLLDHHSSQHTNNHSCQTIHSS